ncbi:MAG: hypothetical protein HYY06_02060 [Deltaproteobacteria bacterium]|nr:hypothetical protein [Deltaproteobacteria bacterium]
MARGLVVVFLGLAGCPDLGAPVVSADPGTISGAISYTAVSSRPLVVEAWDSMPPVGAPLSTTTIASPTFPQPYVLSGVPAGAVFLTARLGDQAGQPGVLGSYPSIVEVSAVDLQDGGGLRGADFALADEGDRPGGPVVQAETRAISGRVGFAGVVRPGDALRGALYASYPPRGAPADFQILNALQPVFPHEYRFTGVRDGNYFTVFYLDRGGDSPFGPGYGDVIAWATDPRGSPVPTTIALGASRSGVDLQIPAQ